MLSRWSLILVGSLWCSCSPVPSAKDAGVPDAGPLAARRCQEPYRTCSRELRFRALDEQSVQVRGNFGTEGWTTGVPMRREGDAWVASVPASFGQDLEYKFLINSSVWVTDPANPLLSSGGNSVLRDVRCEEADATCALGSPSPEAFDWRDAVLEFVFVDRFANGNPANDCTVAGADPAGQYFGGDWAGVTQKIRDGFFTELGVNALWLTVPVKNATVVGAGGGGFEASAYHGYWPIDLEHVESCFGTEAELKTLVDTAHEKGLQVLFDFAMVHMHSSSPLVSAHPDWFWPLDVPGGSCVCDDQGACPWGSQGYRCWFTPYLPHWNYTVAAAREYSVGQAIDLLERTGADGYRLDAIKHVDASWLTALRAELERRAELKTPRPRVYLVGETFDFGNRDYLKSFVDPRTKLDGQFDFPLRLQLLESVVARRAPMTALRDFVASNDAFYGATALMSPWIGNHDLGRVIHMAEDVPRWSNPYADGKDLAFSNQPGLPGNRRPFERLANAFVFLMTSPGVPLLYYGDEIGLPGGGDPDNRRPMPWTGWTADQTWLRDRFAALGAIRKAHPALRRGHRTSLEASDDTWVYAMTLPDETVYVAINRGDVEHRVSGLPATTLLDEYSRETVSGPEAILAPRSARVLVRAP